MSTHNLYCLAPNMTSTKNVVNELKCLGVPEQDTCVLAKDHDAVQRAHLNEAELDDTTDVYDAFKRGLLIGGGLGVISGYVIAATLPSIVEGRVEVFFLVALVCAALGAWVSTMIGVSVLQPEVEKYEADIDQGRVLILADVEQGNEAAICRTLREHHPEVKIEVVEE